MFNQTILLISIELVFKHVFIYLFLNKESATLNGLT